MKGFIIFCFYYHVLSSLGQLVRGWAPLCQAGLAPFYLFFPMFFFTYFNLKILNV
jgi:hypothetical protein